jgi:low temperature requirement protein LtrA
MIRGLLRPPRLRASEPRIGNRHATWLELFYDLIFVVAVAQLGHELGAHLDWRGVGVFALLFVPVWWAWVGHTVYADRFDSDDALHRVLSAVQMFFIAGMALAIGRGVAEDTTRFVVS